MIPLYLSFREQANFLKKRVPQFAGLMLLLSALSLAVFWQTQVPLLFLLLACLLLLGRLLGLAGSAFGLLVVSIIGGFFTASGHGPLGLMKNEFLSVRELALQSFVLVAMLVLYVVEVMTGERNRLEQERKVSDARFRLLTEVSRDMIALVGLDGRLIYASPAVTEVLGWDPDAIRGNDYWARIHPEEVVSVKQAFQEALDGGMPGIFQYRRRTKDDVYIWLEGNVRMYRDAASGEPVGFVVVVRDIASRKVAEEELNLALRMVENLASMDGLTGIANRRRFDEILELEWHRAAREGTFLSLLLIDADHFKNFNDVYGHISGDQCLRQIVERMQTVLQRPADLLARYGGEEFAVILPSTESAGAREIAEKMRHIVETCAIPHTGSLHGVVTLSVGCATQVPQPGSSPLGLLQAADGALYQAKSSGRNQVGREVDAASRI
jgi:diguanylate cyclase (GGDEF)-like protein/PAS domain S-box-containing protein